MTGYDFSDEKIRNLVKANHNPVERTSEPNVAGWVDVTVKCSKDGRDWPCPAVKALREWEEAGEKKRVIWPCRFPEQCEHCHCPGRCGMHPRTYPWPPPYRVTWSCNPAYPSYTSTFTWGY